MMGLIERIRRVFGSSRAAQRDATRAPSGGFCVVDVETTGLSPYTSRILDLAVVQTDADGVVLRHHVFRFNPQSPVGATHIHGITAADVAGAPLFADLVPTLNELFAGQVLVAHNAKFDLAFLSRRVQPGRLDVAAVAHLAVHPAGQHRASAWLDQASARGLLRGRPGAVDQRPQCTR